MMSLIEYRSKVFETPQLLGVNSPQVVVDVSPWAEDDGSPPQDRWITGWNSVVYPYPGIYPFDTGGKQLFSFQQVYIARGSEVLQTFGICGDPTLDYDLPAGRAIYFPSLPPIEVKLVVMLYPQTTANPGFKAKLTLRYLLASDLADQGASLSVAGVRSTDVPTFSSIPVLG